ncbi:MAG TPA: helix-turn-helix transcriptional regulator [Solirubrobacterales bacterium]|nr:helix-turn-helix transcriptional regulator [Solirubrobacterales bacterium]
MAIRMIRVRQRMTQATLGERTGMDSTWVSHIESGRRNVAYGTVRRIARALGVSLSYLARLSLEMEERLRPKPKVVRTVRRHRRPRPGRRGRRRPVVSNNRTRRRPPTEPGDPVARAWGSWRRHPAR